MDRLIEPALLGYPVAWFSPTYKMLSEVWRETKRTLHPITASVNRQERRIELITGAVIDFWSLEAYDSVRGRKYRRIILDEAGMAANLEEAWNAAIRATLTDYRGGAWFLSTPKGMNFFWRAFTYGHSADHPDWASWSMPTVSNPYIDPVEVEAARLLLPERVFQQEYLAVFLEEAGGVFRGVRDAVDAGRATNEGLRPGQTCTLGVDLARVEDFTVITVVDRSGRQLYHERFNQISWERQTEAIAQAARTYRGTVFLDSTGVGDPIFERLRRLGIPVHPYPFTNASKEALIDNLAMRIEQGRVSLMDLPAQTNELLAYQYELTPSRNVRMNAPEGMHDDCVIALALAAWDLQKLPAGLPVTGGVTSPLARYPVTGSPAPVRPLR